MPTDDEILRLVRGGESQEVEFKESLSSSCRQEGAKSLVAFANRDGGKVVFGIADQGQLRGVTVGQGTLETLANVLTTHTYPSLPFFLSTVDVAGRHVVLVETPADRPPLVGVYMYSPRAIDPSQPVDASKLVVYRRVGRTNQAANIMWVRPAMATDPKVRIAVAHYGGRAIEGLPTTLSAKVWVEESSASAHDICFSTVPPMFETEERLDDLPTPYVSSGSGYSMGSPQPPAVSGWRTFHEFHLRLIEHAPSGPFTIVATYSDDLGIQWEATRSVAPEEGLTKKGERIVTFKTGGFRRRIRCFPAKSMAGTMT